MSSSPALPLNGNDLGAVYLWRHRETLGPVKRPSLLAAIQLTVTIERHEADAVSSNPARPTPAAPTEAVVPSASRRSESGVDDR